VSGWGRGLAAGRVLVPIDQVEEAQSSTGRAGLRRFGGDVGLGELSQRELDPEVREIQVLLVDDRRDARVDLDHGVADELDVEEVVELELADDRRCDVHQRGIVERLEVHRETRAHRLSRLRMPEDDSSSARDAVDRPLLAARQLHHEQLGAAVLREQRQQLVELHRGGHPGAVRQQLLERVGARGEDPEAARAGRLEGLHRDLLARVAELARCRGNLRAAGGASPHRPRRADRVEQRVRLGLVVRASHGFGRRDEHRARKAVACRCEPGQVVRRLRQHCVDAFALGHLGHRVGEPRVVARGHDVKRIAQVPSYRELRHIGPHDAHATLAVLAQCPHERRSARRPRGRDEDGEVLHERSIRSAASRSRSCSRCASSIECIVSRIVSPG
jgi:hypothetical protein